MRALTLLITATTFLFSCSSPPIIFPEGGDQDYEDVPITVEGSEILPKIANSDTKPELLTGDTLKVTVRGESSLSITATIDPRGTIEYPLLGTLKIKGLTQWEVQEIVRSKLEEDYIRKPEVFVDIVSYAPRKVFIQGGVGKQGEYILSIGEKISLLQLITLAGGFQPGARKDSIMLFRWIDEEKERKVFTFSFDKLESGSVEQDPILEANDIVIVPKANKLFYIWGAVNSKGPIQVPTDEKLTITKAIALAGGFTKFAASHKVQVMRSDKSTKDIKTFTVNIDDIVGGKVNDDFVIRPGDIIYIPESIF